MLKSPDEKTHFVKTRSWCLFLAVGLGAALWGGVSHPVLAGNSSSSGECEPLGWFPDTFGLKDHSVFIYNGYYYLVSIYLPNEQHFAYARSQDLCHWEDLTPVLAQRSNPWETSAIWAPFVFEEGGVYYMYYTGIKGTYPLFTQSIMLATSTNPTDPDSWILEGMLFQPDHPGRVWQDGAWADCRDPHIVKQGALYYMFYTGRDEDGGIIGLATATDLRGPWDDFGSILTLDSGIPESPLLWQANGGYYLFYNRAGAGDLGGEKYRFGPAPGGPWNEEGWLSPGWAHEIWRGIDGQTYTSYLTDYTVTIRPLIWNTRYDPPQPFIGEQIIEQFLPVIMR